MLIKHLYFSCLCSIYMASTCLEATVIFDPEAAPLCFPKEDFQNPNEKLRLANEYCEASLNTKAIEAYQLLIEELSIKAQVNEDDLRLLMQSRFHLAQVYFSLGNNRDAALALEKNVIIDSNTLSPKLEQLRRHSLYLKALAHKNLKEFAQAKNIFISYIQSKIPTPLPFYEEALFELALINFREGRYEEASKTFESMNVQQTKPRLYALSQIYQARIAQVRNNHGRAAKILETLNPKIENNDPLIFELNYLQGETAFQLHDYAQAIEYFIKALPPTSPEKSPWYNDTLYHLGWSYFKIGDEVANEPNTHNQYLKKAEETFSQLVKACKKIDSQSETAPKPSQIDDLKSNLISNIERLAIVDPEGFGAVSGAEVIPLRTVIISTEENASLALAQCYLSQATRLMQPEYYAKAEALLAKQDAFLSKEGKAHALLLRAEAAPTYEARDQFYKQLTDEPNDSIFYAKGWYMKGLNDFEHGQQLMQSQNSNAAVNSFDRSVAAFEKSFELLQKTDTQQAVAALKYQALATDYSSEVNADLKAFQLLDALLQHNLPIWQKYPNKDEIYYLHGFFAGRVAENAVGQAKEKYMEIAQQSLQTAASTSCLFGDQALNHLGALYFKNGDFIKAEAAYLQLTEAYPTSPLAAEAWVWAAYCADHLQKDLKIGKERRKYAFEHFPKSPYAAEAFFTFYTYPEYLQGDRTTIKHLQNFTDQYTESPFLIDAYYLIGLDYKRDRKTPEGRWIRKKSLTDAIDAFQKAETLFDELSEKNRIPPEKLDYYTAMRYRATLERALGNLAIADEAQGAKKQIYLDYTEEVLKNLDNELHQQHKPSVARLFQGNAYPLIEEESSFWLAQTYIKANKDDEANQILTAMIDKYNKLNTTKGYYLARTHDEQGRIAMRQQDPQKALGHFKIAEEAGNTLSPDQKLDLWIQQSLAYRELGQFDDAILILSKVVNDDAVSSLRMKAMYLRAETYELQKRPEIARKQLESMVKKGGIWARKAQEKLDKADLNHEH